MTDKQLEMKKQELRDMPASKEKDILDRTIWCIEMINSILAYDWFGEEAVEVLLMEERSYHNYLQDYTSQLGRNKVIELIQEQINSIETIKRGVYTDGEGCSYNSIIWKEQ